MEGRAVFLDASPDGGGWGQSLEFGAPLAVRRAETVDGVLGVVDWADQQRRAGRWVVLALAYEAAPAFDSALAAHPPEPGAPLAWAASHERPWPLPEQRSGRSKGSGVCTVSPWRALVPPQSYAANFARLKEEIASGETYQANYTVPFECAFSGVDADDDRAWFEGLAHAQAGGFCAWLDMGRHRVLSLSPELFFRLHGREVLARPMKGTAPRGATPEQDAALREALAQSPKDRAENIMIVDLLRSDLGRVAVPGSVGAPRLFHVEAYPTLFQMTSDVRATLRPDAGLAEVLCALFPCGSVTGAPKVRTMQILREVEPHPRGLYCGAIGLLEPGGSSARERMVFSVPIRTIVLDRDTGLARFGVGGGVTQDSEVEAEYAECLTKMRFLTPAGQDFELLESLLLLRGRYPLLRLHLERLARSAAHFGFVLDEGAVRKTLAALARAYAPAGWPEDPAAGSPGTSPGNSPGAAPEGLAAAGRYKVRLLLTRDGSLRAEAVPLVRSRGGGRQGGLLLGFAREAVDSRDEFLRHKTTRRELYERALASCPGCDDVLLVNERGEVTESTRANLVLRLEGELVTPPLSSGLLPGVFRELLLSRGLVRERVIVPADVLRAEKVWLVNSVRWWVAADMGG